MHGCRKDTVQRGHALVDLLAGSEKHTQDRDIKKNSGSGAKTIGEYYDKDSNPVLGRNETHKRRREHGRLPGGGTRRRRSFAGSRRLRKYYPRKLVAQITHEPGLGREKRYKALSSKGKPEFVTVLKFVWAFGLRSHVTTVSE
jgi:hypothetical protein